MAESGPSRPRRSAECRLTRGAGGTPRRRCDPQPSGAHQEIRTPTDQLDIHDAIEEVLALTRGELQQHSIALRTDLSAGVQPVSGDKVQLQQVVLNLIMNGIQAMAAVSDHRRELTISITRAARDCAEVTVEDTGSGLDPAIAQRIFDPFFTTKSDGLGMGLSICRSIIEAHGGQLWPSPRVPHGTAFHFTIPITVER